MGTHQKYDLLNQLNEIPLLGRQYVPKFWNLIEDEKEFGDEDDKKPTTTSHHHNLENVTNCSNSPQKHDSDSVDGKYVIETKHDLKRQLPINHESFIDTPTKQIRLDKP